MFRQLRIEITVLIYCSEKCVFIQSIIHKSVFVRKKGKGRLPIFWGASERALLRTLAAMASPIAAAVICWASGCVITARLVLSQYCWCTVFHVVLYCLLLNQACACLQHGCKGLKIITCSMYLHHLLYPLNFYSSPTIPPIPPASLRDDARSRNRYSQKHWSYCHSRGGWDQHQRR